MAKYTPTPLGSLANEQAAVTRINENLEDIRDAINDQLDRVDGVPNQMERDLDMNSNHILNVADPVNETDAVNLRTARTLGSSGGGSGGVSDHGALTGLADDDHPQYLNNTRGDARYVRSIELDARVDTRIGAASLNSLSDVVITSPAVGEVVKWNGTNWVNSVDATSGGSGSTNLSIASDPNFLTVLSDTGTDATLLAASVAFNRAGVMTASDKAKLDGIATGATVNSPDATLLNRVNHTGTQLSTTISDFSEAVQDVVGSTLVAGTNVTITYNDAGNTITINASGTGGGATTLNDLNDVSIVLPQEGQFLRYDSAFGWLNSVLAVNDIANFRDNQYQDPSNIGNPFDGDVMQYDTAEGLWVNEALRRPVFATASAGITLGRSYAGKIARSTNGAGITVTLPLDTYNEGEVGNEGKIGQCYYILQDQTGGVTFSPVGGVTVDYANLSSTSNVEDQLIEVCRIAANRFLISRLNSSVASSVVSVNGNTGSVVLTSNSINHDNGAGATTRTTQDKLRDWASLKDWNAVGDNSTNNAAAFTSAEASSYSYIYVPEGTYYFNGSQQTLTKKYFGPGKIRDTTSSWSPGNMTWLTTRPTAGSGVDIDYYFSGDTSKVDASYFLLGTSGSNIRRSLTEPYNESVTTPKFSVFQNFSGWSGTDTRLSASVTAGATVVNVTSTNGLTIGDTIGFNDANDNITDTRTISNLTGTTITLSSGLTNSYPLAARITRGKRTMNPYYYTQMVHRGGGDGYLHKGRVEVSYTPTTGQDHIFFTATGGLFGGDIVASNSGVFLTAQEFQTNDLGNDVGAVGAIYNFNRTNATGARGAFWSGILLKSEGTQAMDNGVCLIGKYRTGLDLANSNSDFQTWRAAIAMKVGDGIFFNNQSVATTLASGLANPYNLTARAIGDTQLRTNLGGSDPYVANANRAGDIEYRLQSQYVTTGTASSGQPTITLASSALAAGLVVGQAVRVWNPTTSVSQDMTIASISGASVTFTGNLTGVVDAGSVVLNSGASTTARHRFFVRGVETLIMGSQITTYRRLNVQPTPGEVTGLNLAGSTNITAHSFAAGGATALPATPKLYIPIMIDGVTYYVPGYN